MLKSLMNIVLKYDWSFFKYKKVAIYILIHLNRPIWGDALFQTLGFE